MDKKVETMEYRVLKVNHQKMVDALAEQSNTDSLFTFTDLVS
jgi:hypothetical protein